MTRGEAMDKLQEALTFLMAGFPPDETDGSLPLELDTAVTAIELEIDKVKPVEVL